MYRAAMLGVVAFASLLSSSPAQERGVTEWLEQLSGGSEGERQAAAQALGRRGDGEALEALLTATLQDESWDVQQSAAIAVVEVGGDVSLHPRLEAAFADEAEVPRRGAALIWVELATTPGSATLAPALVQGLSDPTDRVRYLCAAALYHVSNNWKPEPGQVPEGWSLASAIEPLLPLLTSETSRTRRAGGAALATVAGWVSADDALPILLPALKHEAASVRVAVAGPLGWLRYTPAQRAQVRQALEAMATDPDDDVRKTVAASLERLNSE